MKDLVQQMSARLDQAVETLDASGIDTTDQYYAFFNGVEQKVIRDILASMADADDVLGYKTLNAWRPSIICVDYRLRAYREYMTKCQTGKDAIWLEGSPVVIICPNFFQLKLEPADTDCTTANDRGTFLSGPTLASTQMTVLIEAVIHMYIPDRKVLHNEVHGLNPCMSLSPAKSQLNPQNYAFFVGSK